MVYKLPSVWVWLINNGNDRLEVTENRRSEKGRSENENWVMGVKWDGLNDYADSDLDKRRVSEKGTEVSLSY